MDFLRRLTEEAQLERKGPAVLAAGVFDIYLYTWFGMEWKERE